MPAIAFAREYLCEPMDDVSSLFPSTILQAAKDSSLKLIEREVGDPDDQYFIGWDPAISSDRSAPTILSWLCFAVLLLTPNCLSWFTRFAEHGLPHTDYGNPKIQC